ncbi:hypothetical protein FHS14_000653 [Paenibacillus baekrokdamisoli]|nr:hypothetical protein [Paenibacillus baekrokdamisoli]
MQINAKRIRSNTGNRLFAFMAMTALFMFAVGCDEPFL